MIQYFDDCPSWEAARETVTAAARDLRIDAEIRLLKVENDEDAERIGFRGSPSILVGGRDLFPSEHSPIGMSCRVYSVDGMQEGSPSLEQVMDALRSVAPA